MKIDSKLKMEEIIKKLNQWNNQKSFYIIKKIIICLVFVLFNPY